ncbi:alpha-hydroxy acid oxidase [Acuticoccus mangrovi]|uniref:Alpha-hydroxy-acid oxidizing protein n=1 Tax=Acuticoccus mangrovi TaxID=2796142 RepID=A0A934MJ31_9HYPH|nr:alpha-hydroxy acid oxidase [Acuticoccus mangrovi]MBJ3778495.1 alpha-hydroxy-acid oxidizing protein [Acuticoccus mangrovi]
MNADRTVTAVEDLRILARRRVPRMFYDYVDCGSWSEATYRANSRDFAHWEFKQRVAVNIEGRSTETTLLGEVAAMPVALAPAGLGGMQCADGEVLAARAAGAFGVPFTLSTMSVCSIEDVAEATQRPFWFQLYMMRDRTFMGDLIDRAKAAGCSALVLTLDLQVQGQRHKDIKNGLSTPPKLTVANLLNLLTKPRWCWGMLRAKRRTFGNIVGHAPNIEDTSSMALWVSEQFDQTLDWDAVEWVKARWGGKLILKGIMDPADARLAADAGADAIVVSNHGGRQLDGAPSSIRALPAIVDAVAGRTEIHFDSGVRSGQDVYRAVALGAKGVHIGRAYMYGLGALGEDGVARCLRILRKELDLTMALCGVRTVEGITRDTIIPRS